MAKLTICGGGNAAHTLLALAAGAGWDVDVYAPYDDEARRLRAAQRESGGVTARYAGDRRLRPLFDVDLRPVSSFLTLTLANTGQLIHPGIMYGLCAGREPATFWP